MTYYVPLLDDATPSFIHDKNVADRNTSELTDIHYSVGSLCIRSGWKGCCVDPYLALVATIKDDNEKIDDYQDSSNLTHSSSFNMNPLEHSEVPKFQITPTPSKYIPNPISLVSSLRSRYKLYRFIHSRTWLTVFTITCLILLLLAIFEYPLKVKTGRHGGDAVLVTAIIEIICLLICLFDALVFVWAESYSETQREVVDIAEQSSLSVADHTHLNTIISTSNTDNTPIVFNNIDRMHQRFPNQIASPHKVFRVNLNTKFGRLIAPLDDDETLTQPRSDVIVKETKSVVIPLRRWIIIRFIAILLCLIDITQYIILFSRRYSLTTQKPLSSPDNNTQTALGHVIPGDNSSILTEEVMDLTVHVFRFFRWARVLILISRLRQFRHTTTAFIYAFLNSIQLFVVNIIVILSFGLLGFLLLSNTADMTTKFPIAYDTIYDSVYYTFLSHLAPARIIQIIVPYYDNNEWVSMYAMAFIFVMNLFMLNLLVALGYKAYKLYIKGRYFEKYQRRKEAFELAFELMAKTVSIGDNNDHIMTNNVSIPTLNDNNSNTSRYVDNKQSNVTSIECILLENWMQLCRYVCIEHYNITNNNTHDIRNNNSVMNSHANNEQLIISRVDQTSIALFDALKQTKYIVKNVVNNEYEFTSDALENTHYIEYLDKHSLHEACLLLQLAEPTEDHDEHLHQQDEDDHDDELNSTIGDDERVVLSTHNRECSAFTINVNNIVTNLQTSLDRVHSNDSDYDLAHNDPNFQQHIGSFGHSSSSNNIPNVAAVAVSTSKNTSMSTSTDDIDLDNVNTITDSIYPTSASQNMNVASSRSAQFHKRLNHNRKPVSCIVRLRKKLHKFFNLPFTLSLLCCCKNSNRSDNKNTDNDPSHNLPDDTAANNNSKAKNPTPITPVPLSSPILVSEILSLIPILLSLFQLIDLTLYRKNHSHEEDFDTLGYQYTTWGIIGNVLLGFFILEIAVKIWVLGWKTFRSRNLNMLDIFITFGGLLVFFDGGASHLSHYFLLSLRLLRIFRIFILIPPLKSILLTLSYVMPSLYTIICVFFCFLYGFAVLFNDYFGGRLNPLVNPAFHDGTCDEWLPNYKVMSFDDLWTAFITLTNMATLANWPMLINPVKVVTNQSFIGITLLFVYRIIITMVVFPTFLGFVMDTFNKNMTMVLNDVSTNTNDKKHDQKTQRQPVCSNHKISTSANTSEDDNNSMNHIVSRVIQKANTSTKLFFNDNIAKYTHVTVDMDDDDDSILNKYKYLYR